MECNINCTALLTTGAATETALKLAMSIKTAKNTLTKVFDKTGTRSHTELAVHLLRAGRSEWTT